MKIPKISVVMPAYNASKHISESIESIIQQSFTDFELIIVDDGSTDSTIDIISSFNDRRIRIIQNSHDFIESLNIGLSSARGKYIARMDADDIMLAERLYVQYEFMENNPQIDISGTWIKTFGNAEYEMRKGVDHISLQLQSIIYTPVYHPTVIFKKEIILQYPCLNGIYQVYDKDYIYIEDYRLWICLLMKGYIFANIPQVLLLYRRSDSQVTSIKETDIEPLRHKIRSEYTEYVMEQIIDKDENFYDFLKNSIELYNSGKLHFVTLQQIVSSIYSEILSVR